MQTHIAAGNVMHAWSRKKKIWIDSERKYKPDNDLAHALGRLSLCTLCELVHINALVRRTAGDATETARRRSVTGGNVTPVHVICFAGSARNFGHFCELDAGGQRVISGGSKSAGGGA